MDLVPWVTPMDILRKNAFEFASFSFFLEHSVCRTYPHNCETRFTYPKRSKLRYNTKI